MSPDLRKMFDIDRLEIAENEDELLHRMRHSLPSILRSVVAEKGKDHVITLHLNNTIALALANDIEYATTQFPYGVPDIISKET